MYGTETVTAPSLNLGGTGASRRYVAKLSAMTAFVENLSWDYLLSIALSVTRGAKAGDYIKSIRVYPYNFTGVFPSGSQTLTSIHLGSKDDFRINVSGGVYDMLSNIVPVINLGSIVCRPQTPFNDWRDYKCGYELFVPFYGVIALDPSVCVNKTLNARYYIDPEDATAKLVVTATSGTGTNAHTDVIHEDTTILGFEIPFDKESMSLKYFQHAVEQVKMAASIGAAIAGINPAFRTSTTSTTTKTEYSPRKMFRQTINRAKGETKATLAYQKHINESGGSETTETQSTHVSPPSANIPGLSNDFFATSSHQTSRGTNGFSSMFTNFRMTLKVTKPKIQEPTSYVTMYGRPSNTTVATLGVLANTGYTQVSACHLEGFSTATQEEIEQIEAYLKTGVLL